MRTASLPVLLLVACANSGEIGPNVDLTAQTPHAARRTGEGGFVALEILPTNADGTAIPCGDGDLEVTVTVAGADGHFADVPPQTWRVACTGRTGDLALVVDNSGSEDGYLEMLQGASGTMAGEVIDRGGRASIVRVSTQSDVLVPLTGDSAELQTGIDGMWINDGWTALWDGVRMGNETLGAGAAVPASQETYDDLDTFCAVSRTLGVVAFTDGADNNSSDEQIASYDESEYPGDGLNTTFDGVLDLSVEGVRTPIYTIGLGDEVETERLQQLADQTGGRYLGIEAMSQIPDVFDVVSDYFDASRQVCVELPSQECGDFTLRVDYTWTSDEGTYTGRIEEVVHLPCEDAPEGRVATILLTLGDPNISEQIASTLAIRTVEWVSPVLRPRVLVMLDDGNQGEDRGDAEVVSYLLGDSDNLDVTYELEPAGGITIDDLADVDVLWFSNPGYPMDDYATFETMRAFVASGKGLVLQGDDMTWSWGQSFDTSPLTHLSHIGNGTSACGRTIDNNSGGKYRVTFGSEDHAILRGLAGLETKYGNDIDHSTAKAEGEVVLATATVDGSASCMTPVPVVVVHDPE